MLALRSRLLRPGSSAAGALPRRLMMTSTIAHSRASAPSIPDWASEDARIAAQGMMDRFGHGSDVSSRAATTYHQRLDGNAVQLLRILLAEMVPLSRSEDEARAELSSLLQDAPAEGTPLLPSEHLIFFTPRVPSSALGSDGSDKTFNPPGGVFTRRMWAGGSMTWDPANPLRIGQRAREETRVERVDVKRTAQGDEMLVVWVNKEISNEKGVSLNDRRSWIFRRALEPVSRGQLKDAPPLLDSSHTAPPKDDVAKGAPAGLRGSSPLIQTPSTLFRYSALTYNAHAIHLSPPWAQQREGHTDIVVHGPLNLTLLVRAYLQAEGKTRLDKDGAVVEGKGEGQLGPKHVEYRAKRPLYAGQTYWVGAADEDGRFAAVKSDGTVIMEATMSG